MSAHSELAIRKKRQPSSQLLSPENFHVSLFNAVLGKDPVTANGTGRRSHQAYVEDEDESTQDRAELDATEYVEYSTPSSGTDESSSGEPDHACKRYHRRRSCEERGCLRHGNFKCLKARGRQKHKHHTSKSNDTCSDDNLTSSSVRDDSSSVQETDNVVTSGSDPATESSEDNSHPSSPERCTSALVQNNDTTSGDDDGSGWTLSEDHQLRGMKEDSRNPTWAEIAQVLGKGKSEVKARWKTIKSRPHKPDIDLDDDDTNEEISARDAEPKSKKNNKKTKNNNKHNNSRKAEPPAKSKKDPSGNTTDEADPDANVILSGEEPSSDTDSDPDDLTYGANRERRRQARYLHRHIYSDLYPPLITPRPDEYFGPRDCEILAAVESKWQRSKWLEMQANFYNVTGRMVPLHVIREKCERAGQENERI